MKRNRLEFREIKDKVWRAEDGEIIYTVSSLLPSLVLPSLLPLHALSDLREKKMSVYGVCKREGKEHFFLILDFLDFSDLPGSVKLNVITYGGAEVDLSDNVLLAKIICEIAHTLLLEKIENGEVTL